MMLDLRDVTLSISQICVRPAEERLTDGVMHNWAG